MNDEKIVKLDECELKAHLDKRISESVEEILNLLLGEEAEGLCGAGRCERSPDQVDTRAGDYKCNLHTKAR